VPPAATGLAGLALVMAGVGLAANWTACTMAGNDVARRFGEDILASVAPDGILFTSADYERFPVDYLQIVEGKRPDVLSVDEQRGYARALEAAGLAPPSGGQADESDVARLMRQSKRPIYSTRIIGPVPGTAIQPIGLLYRTFSDPETARKAAEIDKEAWAACQALPTGPWASDWSTASMLASWDIARARSLFMYQGDPKEALALVKQAADRLPTDPVHINTLGALLARAAQPEAALEYYQRAVALQPDYLEANYNTITTLMHLGRWDDAQEAYASATRRGVSFGDNALQIENALLAEKSARPQIARLRDVAATSMSDPTPWLRVGSALLQFNHLDDAEQAVRKAVTMAPTSVAGWRLLATIEMQRGDRAAATEALQNALKAGPKGKEADEIRAGLRMLGVKTP
jgi:tetratricopeptide (TPR) repeat protein